MFLYISVWNKKSGWDRAKIDFSKKKKKKNYSMFISWGLKNQDFLSDMLKIVLHNNGLWMQIQDNFSLIYKDTWALSP